MTDGRLSSTPDEVIISTANVRPVARAGQDQTRRVGQSVTLNGSGSTDPEGEPLTYAWTFVARPEGSTAQLQSANTVNPRFTIDEPGDYDVQLIVSDGTAQSLPDTVRISTLNTAPVANAGPDATARVSEVVRLNGATSSDADGNELTFAWSFVSRPSGSAAALDSTSAVTPRFTIDVAGDYVLQLIVNDGTAPSAADTVRISTVNSAPVANAGADQTGRVGQGITLNGSASSDVDRDALSYRWTFASRPSGSTATLTAANTARPSFTIDSAGSYVLQLVVNDGKIDSDVDSVTVSTENSPPVAQAGEDQSKRVGETVTLDGSRSSDVDRDELLFSWNFTARPEGSAAILADRTSIRPSFVIDEPGTYVVRLVVNDGRVESTPDSIVIATENSAPVADAGPAQTGRLNTAVTLDGSASFDPDGDAIEFSWSLASQPTGSTATITNPAAATPTLTPDEPGDYVAQLIVSDGDLSSAPATVTISTRNSTPVADAGPDQTRILGQTAQLDGRQSNDGDGDALTYRWSFVSRPASSTASIAGAQTATASFLLDVAGSYVVQLVVNDGFADSPPDSVIVTTQNARPTADAGFDQSVNVGQRATLNGSRSFDPDGSALAFRWSFLSRPAGSAATLASATLPGPSFTPDVTGEYVVQLTVNDGTFDSDPDAVTVTAGEDVGPQCEPIALPSGITASDGTFADRVEVRWQPVDGAAEYRVYRSATNSAASATAVSQWTSNLIFTDLSAAAAVGPDSGGGGGCGGGSTGGTPTFTTYYYFVKARSSAVCETELGGADSGYRGADSAKLFASAASSTWAENLRVDVLPNRVDLAGRHLLLPGETVYLRLSAANAPIIAESVEVTANGTTIPCRWQPAAEGALYDGWAAVAYDALPVTTGALNLVAYALTEDGREIQSKEIDFTSETPEDSTMMDQPALVETALPAVLTVCESATIPPRSEGDPFAIEQAAFDQPRRAWLPLPQGIPLEDLILYYYLDGSWIPAYEIDGFIRDGSELLYDDIGQQYLGVLAHHGGIVCFARRPFGLTAEANAAAGGLRHGGAFITLLFTFLMLLGAGTRSRRDRAFTHKD
ncbi:MAG: hypothetical protein IT368_16370 [Candidatus Hydrogenedentes bacterium]|nr:hypothetical protein [Candidatus Hydrogenedentota bacterium]